MQVARRVADLSSSLTLALATKARAMQGAGRDVISLTLGEPDFDTPAHIVEAAHQAALAGQTRYTAVAGTPELRQAIADDFRALDGFAADPERVVVCSGAKQALHSIFQVLLDPGDEVIVPQPCWLSYPPQIALAGGVMVPVPCPSEQNFALDLDALRAAIGPRSRAILLNSPCNPTGAVSTRAEVEAVAELALAHDLVIISDEIYKDLVYVGGRPQSPAALSPEVAARCVTINGVSKAYAMTGWRVGWLHAGAPEISAAVAKLQGHSTSHPSSVSQAAALAALRSPRGFQEEWRAEFDRRRRALVQGLAGLPGVRCHEPTGAFYAFPDLRALLGPGGVAADDMSLALDLLESAGVAVVPGSAFGGPGHLRISYALSYDRLVSATGRLRDYFSARA